MPTDLRAGWMAVVLAVSLSGCAGDSKPQPGAAAAGRAALTEVDACALLQASEISEATGREAGTGAPPAGPEGSPPMCHWDSAQLLVTHAGWKTYEDYDAANRRTLEEQYDPTQYQRLDAPGRFTVVLKDAGMVQTVGERYMVQVAVQPAEGRDVVAAATRLSGLALDRLE
ncbi:MAG TPA: hypothetical protein VFZ26_11650 [Gemmatimonadales bacterium]